MKVIYTNTPPVSIVNAWRIVKVCGECNASRTPRGNRLFHAAHRITMWPSFPCCAASNSEPSLSQTTEEANETF